MSFAFVCHHSSFIVFNSLRKPTRGTWRKVTHVSVAVALTASMIMALSGYLAFFSEVRFINRLFSPVPCIFLGCFFTPVLNATYLSIGTQVEGDVLNNLATEDSLVAASRLLLALTMVFTFPMEQFVARHCLLSLAHELHPSLHYTSSPCHYGATLLLWGSSFVIGLIVSDLGIVLELTGADKSPTPAVPHCPNPPLPQAPSLPACWATSSQCCACCPTEACASGGLRWAGCGRR